MFNCFNALKLCKKLKGSKCGKYDILNHVNQKSIDLPLLKAYRSLVEHTS